MDRLFAFQHTNTSLSLLTWGYFTYNYIWWFTFCIGFKRKSDIPKTCHNNTSIAGISRLSTILQVADSNWHIKGFYHFLTCLSIYSGVQNNMYGWTFNNLFAFSMAFVKSNWSNSIIWKIKLDELDLQWGICSYKILIWKIDMILNDLFKT